MSLFDESRRGRIGYALVIAACAAVLGGASALAQTPIKFTLDGKFEGPIAPFVVAIDKGYFKSEGLEVTIDSAANPAEAINRIASGGYDMGFADVNALIKFRDQNPGAAVKAVFMVYNKPAFSIVGRKSRGVFKPKDLEGKKLGAPPADGAYAQWPIFVNANNIDASKVTTSDFRCASRCSPPARSTRSRGTRSRPTSTSRIAACRRTTSMSC